MFEFNNITYQMTITNLVLLTGWFITEYNMRIYSPLVT